MNMPVLWGKVEALKDFDGIVWMRKVVEIPASLAGKDLKLSLGAIDDEDVTYWNGQRIGMNSGWNRDRNYTVPGKLVKAGKNVLTIRVYDTGGDGDIPRSRMEWRSQPGA